MRCESCNGTGLEPINWHQCNPCEGSGEVDPYDEITCKCGAISVLTIVPSRYMDTVDYFEYYYCSKCGTYEGIYAAEDRLNDN